MKKIDLAGKRFGKLTVLTEAGKNKAGQCMWNCQCDCGKPTIVNMSNLRNGHTISCGCNKGMPYGRAKKIGERGPRRKDLKGYRSGRLTVVSFNSVNDNGDALWNCVCDCGSEFVAGGSHIKNGDTSSCGCLRREIHTKHNGSHLPEYAVWEGIIQRCTNPNSTFYEYYGGRGITVCDRWRDFGNFFEDMGERPDKLTIDRIDGNGNYEPGNCRWASRKDQVHHLRKFKTNSSGHTGIFHDKKSNTYRVSIGVDNKTKSLGSFSDLNDAIVARKDGERMYWKEALCG